MFKRSFPRGVRSISETVERLLAELKSADRRLQADEGFDALLDKEEVAGIIEQVREFLKAAEEFLGS